MFPLWRIVALTANALVGNEAMFLKNGFQAFLSKPIDTLKLDLLLNTWIRGRRGQEMSGQAEGARKSEAGGENAPVGALAGRRIEGLSIEGLNIEGGCSRFGGESAYMEVLRSYATHTPDLLDKLRDAREETLPEYTVAVHGLKGSSYGICAEAVGKMAEDLELAAERGDFAAVREKNGELVRQVEALLSNLRDIFRDIWGETSRENGEKEEMKREMKREMRRAPDRSLLRRLRERCVHYDMTGMENAMAELERYTYEVQDDLVKWLRKQVNDLEYGQILERLETIV